MINPFKHSSKSKFMNPKLAIILIIIGAGMSGIVYASSTVISDTGIITPSITVSGTCTGCGNEPSFSSYSLVLNQTVTGTGGSLGNLVQVSTDGSVLAQNGQPKTSVIKLDGTIVNVLSLPFTETRNTFTQQQQSTTGQYKIILNSTQAINIYKNNIFLQKIQVNINSAFTSGQEAVGISSDGKYIAIFGNDKSGAIDRIIIYQGS